MQVKTWLQRLTDESNLWFSAVKAEDEHDYLSAITNYVDDALMCIDQNLVRSALSCSCAANCLAKTGAISHAKGLYNVAGMLYLRNSELTMSESIRETMWSLRESMANFVLAGDSAQADLLRRRYNSLAARTNPFARQSELAEMALQEPTQFVDRTKELPSGIVEKLRKLIDASNRLLAVRSHVFDPKQVSRSVDRKKESVLSEKSIAS